MPDNFTVQGLHSQGTSLRKDKGIATSNSCVLRIFGYDHRENGAEVRMIHIIGVNRQKSDDILVNVYIYIFSSLFIILYLYDFLCLYLCVYYFLKSLFFFYCASDIALTYSSFVTLANGAEAVRYSKAAGHVSNDP